MSGFSDKFNKILARSKFNKDLKKLEKRYKIIKVDLRILIDTQLFLYHKQKKDLTGIFQLRDLISNAPPVYKVKKFACRSLPGRGAKSGLRLIYSYIEEKDRIILIEIYYKGDKEKEDRKRINEFLKQ